MAADSSIDALTGFIKSLMRKERGSWASHVQGTFVSAETNDPNLSIVTVLGTNIRFVRKLSSVGTMTAGQQLLLLNGGGIPMTIVGVVVGNITRTGS